ncbi:hypothetical protein LSAT2_011135 [Lamellibrachia satsuma]|nr:hypothetical protein LSAT2_011135 [Lamellibrachia satsuma]
MSPNNTDVESGDPNAHVYNTTIVYRCAEGHDFMFGDLSRTCQSSKTWSGQTPTCKVVSCGPPAPVANAHATMTGEAYLANITYECKPGFRPEPDGDWTRQCQTDKRWSGTAPLCRQIVCKAPPVVANTSLTTDGVRVNDTATYTCLAGHRLRAGNLTKVCNDSGQWQNDDPQCIEVHCGPPLELAYTNYLTSGGDTVGGKVMYTCIHGYERRSGSGFSRCPLIGEWTTPTLVCEEVTCGMPEPVKDAVMTTSCVRRDCVADYRCDVGYVGDTRQSRCMVDGQWTPVSLRCSRVRCGETGEGEGTIVTDQTGDSYEDTVTIECRHGHHRITGSHLRTCLGGGTWSGTTLICAQTTCLTPANVIGALVSIGNLTVGSNVTYRAQNTYRHVGGDLVRTCREDKLWTGEQPVFKEITCPAIQSSEDSKVKFFSDGVIVGSHVTYSCVAGYRLSAGDATCDCFVSGKWSCGPPTCTRVICGQPPTVANSRSESTGLSYLDNATYTCKPGYRREGPQYTLVCSEHAQWEGNEITCTEITCPPLELPPMTKYNVTALTYMSRVTYSCHPGYKFAGGDEVRTCRENGTWSGEPPKCEKVECTRPPDVVNATWYEDKKSLRTRRVIYLCLPRYRLVSGQLWKVCGPRGNWTGVDPVCEATGEEVSIFVPEDEEPKTHSEKVMASVGIKKADKKPPNIAIGVTGMVMMIIPVVLLVVSDFNLLKEHLKMMVRNLKEGFRHFTHRGTKVAPSTHPARVDRETS